jgi:hypothetical protein
MVRRPAGEAHGTMSKMIWIVLVAAAGLAGGLWFARQGGFHWRGEVDRDVPPALVALHAQLRKGGVDSHVGLVRREHTEVRARALFTLHDDTGENKVFFVSWCTSPEAALKRVQELQRAARPSLPEANGAFVLYMTDWPAGGVTTQRVQQAFRRFDAAAADALSAK